MFVKHFCRQKCCGRRKMKCWGSPETRFPEVWNRSEPSSGGKRPFEVSEQNFFCRKMKCRGSPETRFPKVGGRSEPSSRGKRPFEVLRKKFDFEKWNVGDRLKGVFPKFEAERSHPAIIRGRRMISPTAMPIIRRLRFSLYNEIPFNSMNWRAGLTMSWCVLKSYSRHLDRSGYPDLSTAFLKR